MPKGRKFSDNLKTNIPHNIQTSQQFNTAPNNTTTPQFVAPTNQQIAYPQAIPQAQPTSATSNHNIHGNMSVQQNHYPQFNQFNNFSRAPVNDAIAFTSMIDSNIGGKLNDLFPDTSNYNYQPPIPSASNTTITSASPNHVYESFPIPHDIQSSFRSVQNEQFYGNQLNNHQKALQHQFAQFASQSFQRQPFPPPAYFPSDPESSPEIPKTNSFEHGHMHYKPALGVYQSPNIKHDLDTSYSASPSLGVDQSFYSTPGNMSYYSQSQHPYPFRDQSSSTSSNATTTASSKPSLSISTTSTNSTFEQGRNGSVESFKSMSSNRSLKTKKTKKPINLRGGTCKVCGKVIKRDMTRHMRIHEEVSRFRCVYPRVSCIHKTGFFNRQYDFKKHLLHFHFDFDDSSVKKLYSLNEKLPHWGTCYCGLRFTGGDWLQNHILTKDKVELCPHLARLREKDQGERKNNPDYEVADEDLSPGNEGDKSVNEYDNEDAHDHSDNSFDE